MGRTQNDWRKSEGRGFVVAKQARTGLWSTVVNSFGARLGGVVVKGYRWKSWKCGTAAKKYTEKVFKFLKLFAIIKLRFVKNRRNLSGEIPYFG